MRILYISAEPIRQRQASDTHINEIVRCLRELGHDVTLCVTRVMGPYESTPFIRRLAGYALFWLQAIRRIGRIDVIYARAHPANFPIALIAWLFGRPVIHEVNGTYLDIATTHRWLQPYMRIIRALYHLQYQKAGALIAVTPGLAEWLRQETRCARIAVVANGVNSGVFRFNLVPTKPHRKEYVLFFGSLTRWHGIEVMLAAAEGPDWPAELDLLIIGNGQLAAMVQEQAQRNPKIHMIESLPQDLLVDYIDGAIAGLVPINSVSGRGRYGLSPLKLYEMLACGLPVIVTDFPGQADLVRSLDGGIVIPPDDATALARAVAKLLHSPPPDEKMAKVASVIEREHNWSQRARVIEAVLLAATSRAPQ